MPRFTVPDIHCDSCVRSITAAVHAVDPAAEVHVDLVGLSVDIRSAKPEAALEQAIDDAGFTVRRAA